nr:MULTISPECIES: lactate dehydrogenase [unclassified Fusibacter]
MTEKAYREAGVEPIFDRRGQKKAYFDSLASKEWFDGFKAPFRVTVLGLGDVGGTLAIALRTISPDVISEIGIYDLDDNRIKRYEFELNQIYDLGRKMVPVVKVADSDLFNTDIFIFTASKAVPEVGSAVSDVRMAQFEANAGIVRSVMTKAVKSGFKGLFCVVSDPVDLLCQVAKETAVAVSEGAFCPIQVKGFGLGVMYARARYYADKEQLNYFEEKGRVFGPHGKDLIVVNALDHDFNEATSLRLREKTIRANLAVRDTGYKPYIAPAISSAAFSIISLLEGRWHHSTIPFGSQYLGIKNRWTKRGVEIEEHEDNPMLRTWIENTLLQLENDYDTLPDL